MILYCKQTMKKVLAELIAGVIPRKMARNRWRGVLRFGLLNAIKLKKEIKNNNSVPTYYLTVQTLVKNEASYFQEWLDYYLALGVEKFYIYDNGSTDNTREILAPYIEKGVVEYTYFPGTKMQLAAYDDCLKRHRFETRWLAFIDVDEFIVISDGKTLPQYLKPLEKSPVVEINWLCYGSSGQTTRQPGGVMQRFKRHSLSSNAVNKHVKSIVNPRRIFSMIGAHEAARINGKGVDGNGNIIKTSWRDRTPVHDKIKINHYAVKSYEEFVEKKGKGRGSGRVKMLQDDYFHRFDLNDIEEQ